MTILKKIDAISAGKIIGMIGLIIGLIAGIILAIVAITNGSVLNAISALILTPIMYGISGFIGGLIEAFIFNLAADKIGGLEIELE